MKRQTKPVLGVTAPPASPTLVGGIWLAAIVTLPLAVLIAAVHLVGMVF